MMFNIACELMDSVEIVNDLREGGTNESWRGTWP